MLGLTGGAILLCRRAQNLDQLAVVFAAGTIGVMGQVAYTLLKYSQGLSTDAVRSVVSYFPTASITMLGLLVLGVGASLWRAGHSVRPWYWHILTVAMPLIGYCAYYVGWGAQRRAWIGVLDGQFDCISCLFYCSGRDYDPTWSKLWVRIFWGTGAVVAWGMAAYIGMTYNDPWLTVMICRVGGDFIPVCR